MAWGRMDDGFDDHPKVLALLEEEQGVAAVGLWTLCWTWAHRNTRKAGKTAGAIPSGLPRRYVGIIGRDLAKLLVAHGLWDVTDDGWVIHDFGDYLPTEETRAARAAAGRRGAEKRWGNKRIADATGAEANTKQDDGNLLSGSHGDDGNAVATDGSRAPARRAPEPEPNPEPGSQAQTQEPNRAPARGTRLANDLLDEHLAACSPRPNRRVVERTGDAIDALLGDQNISADDIRAGLTLMRQRPGKGPGLLPDFVDEARTIAAAGGSRASPARRQPHRSYRNPDNDDVYDEDFG